MPAGEERDTWLGQQFFTVESAVVERDADQADVGSPVAKLVGLLRVVPYRNY